MMTSVLPWTSEEDALLRALIEEHGPKKWALISGVIGTKSSKQCRRRWKNVLDMDAKATVWTAEEDARLVQYHRELGNKWTQISQRFGDRTDNAVKNRWHALCRKQPDLAEEESPVTTVGVRRGTRTRQDGSSEDISEISRKRQRGDSGYTGSGLSVGAGRASWGAPPPQQPSRATRSTLAHGLPTPFDQQHARGHLPAPLNLIVQRDAMSIHDLQLANQVNSQNLPVHIEVAEFDQHKRLAQGGAPGAQYSEGPYGFGGSLSSLASYPDTNLNWNSSHPSFSFGVPPVGSNNGSGSGTAAAAAAGLPVSGDSLSLSDLINWLNSTSASAINAAHTGPVAQQQQQQQQNAPSFPHLRSRNGPSTAGSDPLRIPSSGVLNIGASGSTSGSGSGLTSEQRDLLCRLISHAKESVELQQLHSNNAAAAAAAAGGGNGPGQQLVAKPEPLGLPPAPSDDAAALLNPAGSSFNMGMGLGSLSIGLGNVSTRIDPMGRTRSASTSGGSRSAKSNSWAEAAAAAIAAVDQAMGVGGMPAPSSGPVPLSHRPSSRDRKANMSGGGGAGSPRGGSGEQILREPLAAPPTDVTLLAPTFSQEDIDLIIQALSYPQQHAS